MAFSCLPPEIIYQIAHSGLLKYQRPLLKLVSSSFDQNISIQLTEAHLIGLIVNNQLRLLELININWSICSDGVSEPATTRGFLDILKFLVSKGCPLSKDTCLLASYYGHDSILLWAYQNKAPLDEGVTYYLACRGKLDLFKWAVEQGCVWNKEECLSGAVANGNVEMAKYLLSQGSDLENPLEMIEWEKPVYWPMLEWIEKQGIRLIEIAEWAFYYDNVDVIQWLYMRSGHIEGYYKLACKQLSLGIIKWCFYMGLEVNSKRISSLIKSNCDKEFEGDIMEQRQVEILKYLISIGCQLIPRHYSKAIKCDKNEMIKILQSFNCPWNHECFIKAIQENRSDIMDWLIEQNYLNINDQADLWHVAIHSCGTEDGLEWLRKHKVPYPPGSRLPSMAAYFGQLEKVKWFWANGFAFDISVLDCAIEGKQEHVYQWLSSRNI